VNIRVERCQWYVQREDTLIQVAARFATNWLQIWHFNPEILHPDSELEPGSLINIGHLYEVSVCLLSLCSLSLFLARSVASSACLSVSADIFVTHFRP
jgi:hypothetical protein